MMFRYFPAVALIVLPTIGHGQDVERVHDIIVSRVVQEGCSTVSAASAPADIVDRARIYAFRLSDRYGEGVGPCTAAATARCMLVALEALDEQPAAIANFDQNASHFRDAEYYQGIAAVMPGYCEGPVNDG
jgi:hypothetical protein